MIAASELHRSLADPALSVMTFLNEVTDRFPDAISFAPGRPHEGFFDLARIPGYLSAFIAHLREEQGKTEAEAAREVLQYGPAGGIIRHLVCEMLRRDDGIVASPADVLITTGCQEALLIVLRTLFAGPGDVLLVPSPTYTGITGAAALLDITVREVPEGPAGLDPETVADIVRRVRADGQRPRALYVIPESANPSGACLTEAVRRSLLALAEAEDLLLLEDSAYAVFSPPGAPPALKAMDASERVIHLGTFAKAGFPGLRVGYLVAGQRIAQPGGEDRLLAEALADVKSMITVNTSPVAQAVAGGLLLRHGLSLREAGRRAADFYRDNLRIAAEVLRQCFGAPGDGVSWNEPDRGFFLVVTVPFEADEEALLTSARDFGVLWTPMRYFQPGGGARAIRLSVSYLDPGEIRDGLHRLADFIGYWSATRGRPGPVLAGAGARG